MRCCGFLPSSLSLSLSYTSFDAVPIPPNSTVYADPPYVETKKYLKTSFDHSRFYNWLRQTPFPVYISEYRMPEDFVCIAEKQTRCILSAQPNNAVTERLFLHKRFADRKVHPDLFLDP